ncbi:unnamed protein product [Phyllotreta striolata]|uniref:Carboxylesterase type B domain-containing protein n=1 Tax=Phyllotreta striolata TaxID=444603 RepID=A0A9N9XSH2_PHYSR|nr:unnamed protein product [Phyllotreta striolata]
MKIVCTILLFVSFTGIPISGCDTKENLIVEVHSGKIQGHVLKSGNGKDYYAFQEIPYAAPPIGKLRFRLPQEPEKWPGVLPTTKNTKVCYQSNAYNLNKTEDCLYLNVYTPVIPGGNESLPILFWIHGGGFNWGSGTYDDYGPKYLMGQGIIVVSTNYRLNPFGFLSTEDGVIPGNLGMIDVQFALKWVQKNIHLFGGNPNQVIIAGESCGSMGVNMLLLGPWSDGKPLFHGAIMESSSQLGGVYQVNARENAFALARRVNASFSSNDSYELLEVLQNASTDDLFQPKLIMGTTTEKTGDFSYPALQAYMDGNIKKVPLLIGINSEERITSVSSISDDKLAEMDKDPSLLISPWIHMSPENRTIAGKLLKKLYTNKTFVEDHAAYIRWATDIDFATPTGKQVQLGAKYAPNYLYKFSYWGEMGANHFQKNMLPGAERVGHMEELHYYWVFENNDDLSKFPQEDQNTLWRMIRLWTNFVKYLNPTPVEDPLLFNITWPTSKPDTLDYLNINSTFKIEQNLRMYKEISSILDKYMEPPYEAYGHI